MIVTATAEFQSHPNIGAIYDDMVKEAVSPVSQHHHPRAHVKTFTVSTKTFDGADDDVPPTTTATTSDEGIKKTFTIITKTFDGSTPPPPPKTEKRSFSRKNSTDSAFSIYNDDDMWSQRIGEIMNRGIGAAAAVVSPSQEEQSSPPIDTVRVSSSSSATASSSQPKIRRCQSTDCPSFTMLQSHQQGRESAWLKKQQFGGSLSRRNSMEGGGGGGNTKALFARKNSRSTSPRFIPPIDSFGSDATNPVTAPAEPTVASAATKPKGGFSRRNSMTRSRSPKFVEPLSTSDHDESRVFKGRMMRRHTLNEGPTTNPFTSHQLETLRESLRGTNDIAEQVKQRLLMEGLDDDDIDEPSTPKADDKDDKQKNTVPKRPFSRHNSVEGVDPSIFPSLPLLDQSDNSNSHDDSDPNLDLALLFEHLVQDEEADDDASSDEEDDDDEDNIIKRHMKSKIRRRCSTGGLRSFERENFRNFLEDTEGDDARPVQHVSGEGGDRRGSLFRKCSTGGLRTLQRENSRDLYSDDCSLDGKKGRVHLSNDTSFEAYLRKLTQEADVDTSNDANIINHHVGGAVRRRRSSIRSVSSHVDATEDPADFAQFISRIGQGVSSSLTTASTAANTSYSEESYGSPREIETVRSSFKKLPHSINLPSALDESVSSLENSSRQGRSYISTVKAPLKDAAEVNFRSSKSRSIRRLASNDGIEELQRLAKGIEPPATRRSSYSGIRTPDPEEIALEDLPGLIKNIDRDLVTERAVYQQRRSSGSEPAKGEAAQVDERSASVQFSSAGPRKPIEPPGTLASCVSDEDDVPKPRRQQQTHCMEDSVVSTEFQSIYIAKGYVEPQKGEIPPVPMIVVQEVEGASVAGIAKYQPKRRRSISDDRQRFDKQGKSFDERRRQGTGLK